MKTILSRIYYKLFKRYRVIETTFVSYLIADQMIKESHNKSEGERWVIAKEEDYNRTFGWVWLCRKIRITE